MNNMTPKERKTYIKDCVNAVPSSVRKDLTDSQRRVFGWFIVKYKWEKEEEIKYTKGMIAEDVDIQETTVVSVLKSLVCKEMLERTHIGVRGIPSRVVFGKKVLELLGSEGKTENPHIEERNNPNPTEIDTSSENAPQTSGNTPRIDCNPQAMQFPSQGNENVSESLKTINSKIEEIILENSSLREFNRYLQDEISILKEEISTLRELITNPPIQNTSQTSGNGSGIDCNPQAMQFPSQGAEKPSESLKKANSKIESRNAKEEEFPAVANESTLSKWFRNYQEFVELYQGENFNFKKINRDLDETIERENIQDSEEVLGLYIAVFQYNLGKIVPKDTLERIIKETNKEMKADVPKAIGLEGKTTEYLKLYNKTLKLQEKKTA